MIVMIVFLKFYLYLSVCMHHMYTGAFGGRKMLSVPLELESHRHV